MIFSYCWTRLFDIVGYFFPKTEIIIIILILKNEHEEKYRQKILFIQQQLVFLHCQRST
jgi:hypothetical protein